jgi:hypothetical protein
MSVFEELLAASQGESSDLDDVVYYLCEDEFGEGFVPYAGDYEKYKQDLIKMKEDWGYEHLEQDGGGEGGSEYCYGIFKLKGKIYKAEYSYYSHHGHDYDEILDTLKEVTPKEKLITVYE